jgi:8-oxo-dGTP pyrophosphatase MutT (NUDIX family)
VPVTIDIRAGLGVPTDGVLELHVNPGAAAELREALEEAGLDVDEGFAHADSPGKPDVIFLISTVSAALPGLAKVLDVVLHRHDQKHFRVGEVEAKGYTAKELLPLLRELESTRGPAKEEWRRRTGIEVD